MDKNKEYQRGYDAIQFALKYSGKSVQELYDESENDLSNDDFNKGWQKGCQEEINKSNIICKGECGICEGNCKTEITEDEMRLNKILNDLLIKNRNLILINNPDSNKIASFVTEWMLKNK